MNAKFRVLHPMGRGAFSSVFEAESADGGARVALKTEDAARTSRCGGTLRHEAEVLHYLSRGGVTGVPRVVWFGLGAHVSFELVWYSEAIVDRLRQTRCLALPLFAVRLLDSLDGSLDAVCVAMTICIGILRDVHKMGVLHRDVKPSNLMADAAGAPVLIDFGLSSVYVENESFDHAPNEPGHTHLVGTARYASVFVMAGETPSRRDDLISLGYVYARALALPAPWDTFVDGKEANLDHASMVAVAREKRRAIRGGMGDARLKTYMHACHSLGYADAPDYAALQKIFAKEA